jgi:hypothetical protein
MAETADLKTRTTPVTLLAVLAAGSLITTACATNPATWGYVAVDRGARESRGAIKAATLAVMNNHAIADKPRPGERLKVVV